MHLLKYTLVVGSSLLALILAAEHVIAPSQSAASAASTSLDVLRKMANHGEMRGFAPLAAAGEFLPMHVKADNVALAATPAQIDSPVKIAAAPASEGLDAQARASDADIVDRPARPAKKTASRKPKHARTVYVENLPRGPSSFFGSTQSW